MNVNPITRLDYPDPDVIRGGRHLLYGIHNHALYAGL